MKKVIIPLIAGAVCFLFLMMLPVIIVSSAVTKPFELVNGFFQDIGDFMFGQGTKNDVTELIDSWLSLDEGKDYILNVYVPAVSAEQEISVPVNYLLIPNLIVGLEEPTQAQFDTMIDCMKLEIEVEEPLLDEEGEPITDEDGNPLTETIIVYELREMEEYIELLRRNEPWKSAFGEISTSTICGYVQEFAALNIYGGIGSEYLEGIEEGELIYPFKRKANVTAGFGWYAPFGEREWHPAIDLAFPRPNNCGEPIYAIQKGEVIAHQSGSIATTGNYVYIQNGNMVMKYIHMAEPYPYPVGHQVNQGDFIGTVGATGITTGCHLHLGIEVDGKAVDPKNYIDFENPWIP